MKVVAEPDVKVECVGLMQVGCAVLSCTVAHWHDPLNLITSEAAVQQ